MAEAAPHGCGAIVVIPNALLVAFAVAALRPETAYFIPVWLMLNCGGFNHFLWRPNRVTLDESGVELVSVARHIRIRWEDLDEVAPSTWTMHRGQLYTWRRLDGRPFSTRPFIDMHQLLNQLERRAPDAYISS